MNSTSGNSVDAFICVLGYICKTGMALIKDQSSWYNADGSLNYTNIRTSVFAVSTEESCCKALEFKPRATDIIIATPLKCGTTWLQQIVHQLRTGGDMDFDNIKSLIPWLEMAHDFGMDLEAKQRGEPIRAFKSHSPYDFCPKGAKYIAVFREPCAAAYSFYKFMLGKTFPESVPLDAFITELWLKMGDPPNPKIPWNASYFANLISWIKHRSDSNVLILFFEEMKEDLEKVVRAIASFIGVRDEEKIQTALRMSTFEFMKANEDKFNVQIKRTPTGFELPQPVPVVMVRTGSTTEGIKALSDDAKSQITERWEKEITKATGYITYEDLRIGIRKECPLLH